MIEQGQYIREYQVIGKIAEGGMGEVWEVDHPTLGRRAIKVLSREIAGHPEALQRFKREASLMGHAKHPNIMVPHDFFNEAGEYFLLMPYMEGGDLSHRIATHPEGMPLEDVKTILHAIQGALAFAHSVTPEPIIHRDVKPRNILFDSHENAYLSDFGIAKGKPTGALSTHGLSNSRRSLGTPAYMSPEHIKRPGEVDARSDQYSLGCVIYEMLTGHSLFEEELRSGSDWDVEKAHVEKEPPSPRLLRGNIPPEWEALLATMLAKNQGDRFQSDSALSEAIAALPIEPYQGNSASAVPPKAQLPAPPRRVPRNQTGKWLVALLATVLLLGGGAWLIKEKKHDPPGTKVDQAIDGPKVPLPYPHEVINPGTHARTCDSCKGSGKVDLVETPPCEDCQGKGKVVKVIQIAHAACGGSGYLEQSVSERCSVCEGAGTVYEMIDCKYCDGTGERNCRSCNGTGTVMDVRGPRDCRACNGEGNKKCGICDGAGKKTDWRHKVKCTAPGCRGEGTITSTRKVPCSCDHGKVNVNQDQTCAACSGSGKVTRTRKETCPKCQGKGTMQA